MIWTNPHHREVDGDRREGFGLARRTLWLARISADADAYAYADADADADASNPRSPNMRSGLYAVSLTQGNLTVLRVGWFRRDASDPDEYDVEWCTPYRGETLTRLAEVWAEGPKKAPRWTWSPRVPSVAHRFHFHPLARLDPKLWKSVVGDKPEGWES